MKKTIASNKSNKKTLKYDNTKKIKKSYDRIRTLSKQEIVLDDYDYNNNDDIIDNIYHYVADKNVVMKHIIAKHIDDKCIEIKKYAKIRKMINNENKNDYKSKCLMEYFNKELMKIIMKYIGNFNIDAKSVKKIGLYDHSYDIDDDPFGMNRCQPTITISQGEIYINEYHCIKVFDLENNKLIREFNINKNKENYTNMPIKLLVSINNDKLYILSECNVSVFNKNDGKYIKTIIDRSDMICYFSDMVLSQDEDLLIIYNYYNNKVYVYDTKFYALIYCWKNIYINDEELISHNKKKMVIYENELYIIDAIQNKIIVFDIMGNNLRVLCINEYTNEICNQHAFSEGKIILNLKNSILNATIHNDNIYVCNDKELITVHSIDGKTNDLFFDVRKFKIDGIYDDYYINYLNMVSYNNKLYIFSDAILYPSGDGSFWNKPNLEYCILVFDCHQ